MCVCLFHSLAGLRAVLLHWQSQSLQQTVHFCLSPSLVPFAHLVARSVPLQVATAAKAATEAYSRGLIITTKRKTEISEQKTTITTRRGERERSNYSIAAIQYQ